MEDPISTLLPYILETLSRKPELCDTFDHICKEIEEQLIADNNTRYGNVRKALQRAIDVGQSLGILTLTNETIRMPFNFRSNTPKHTNVPATTNQQVQQPAIGTGNPVVQNTTDRNVVSPSKTSNRKVQQNFDKRREDPNFMFQPPMPSRNVRGRPPTTRWRNSRGKSRRVRKRGRSGHRRRVSRKR